MKVITLITLFGSLVFSSTAQNDKAALKAELKELSVRVMSSSLKTSSSASATRVTGVRQTNSESKLAKFSGCKLSFSGAMKDRRADDNYYWTVSVPLKHIDSVVSSIRRDRSGLWIDLITIGAKISRTGLISGTSSVTMKERQVSSTSFTNRYRTWMGTEGDPEVIAKDLLRAIEICKSL